MQKGTKRWFGKMKPFFSNRLLFLFVLLWVIRFLIELIVLLVGNTSLNIALRGFTFGQIWQAGEMLCLFIIFYYAGRIDLLRPVHPYILFLFSFVIVTWAIADPIVVALAGDHLTPSLLAHFAGPKIFLSDELWLPIKTNYILVLSGLALILLLIISLYRIVQSTHKQNKSYNAGIMVKSGIWAALLLLIPYLVESRYLLYPPEITFIRNAWGWDQYEPTSNDIQKLRQWLSDDVDPSQVSLEYPLVKKIENDTNNKLKPNIIVLVIESLRARETRLFNPSRGNIALPGLERFAKNGLTFPYFISNGFPSSEGFISISMGIWPHGKDRIIISHKDKNFPSLSCILGRQGYETYYINEFKDLEEQGFWVESTFDHHITYADREIFPSAKNMIKSVKEIAGNHINDSNSKPFFIHLKTRNPHYPYEISDDKKNQFYTVGTPRENYFKSMSIIDEHVNDLYSFLEQNGLMDNTIVVIMGDHANYLDKYHTSSLPTDETMWTGGIIAGPESIIGKPSTIFEHASLVDISTTLLHIAGYNSEWILFGRNILKRKHLDETYSIAVRPSGIRFDYAGNTYIVDRSYPSNFIHIKGFDDSKIKNNSNPPLSTYDLLNMVDTWSFLVENNRVFPPYTCNNNRR